MPELLAFVGGWVIEYMNWIHEFKWEAGVCLQCGIFHTNNSDSGLFM